MSECTDLLLSGTANCYAAFVAASALTSLVQKPFFQASTGMLCYMQSGMHEETLDTIELGGMEGPVLEALMSFLYGSLAKIPAELLLPLYVAADAHQV